MTLVIGILCSNGVVIGADGAATMGALGDPTIRQPVDKLTIIENRVIVGFSGHVGLGQRHIRALEKIWADKKVRKENPIDVMVKMKEGLLAHTMSELQVANVAAGLYGPVARQSAQCHTLVAAPLSNKACLFQFDQQCAPEMATEELPFVAIGSGQKTADPFLAFLRKIFWEKKLPSLSEGVLAALWTLKHAIETTPGFLSDPIQIADLKQDNNKLKARIIPEEERLEHLQFIAEAEEYLKGFWKSRDEEPPPAIPQP